MRSAIAAPDAHANVIIQMARLKRSNASEAQQTYILALAAHGAAKHCADKDVAELGAAPTNTEIGVWAGLAADADWVQRGEILSRAIYGIDGDDYKPEVQHPYFRAKDAIEQRWQLCRLSNELRIAEDAMIAWASSESQRIFGVRYAQIKGAFDAWPLHGDMRAKLLDIVVRMPGGGK